MFKVHSKKGMIACELTGKKLGSDFTVNSQEELTRLLIDGCKHQHITPMIERLEKGQTAENELFTISKVVDKEAPAIASATGRLAGEAGVTIDDEDIEEAAEFGAAFAAFQLAKKAQ